MTDQLTHTDTVPTTAPTTVDPPPAAPNRPMPADRPDKRRKWVLFAAAAGAAVVASAAVTFANLGTDTVDAPVVAERPAYVIVQGEIDAALAERRAESVGRSASVIVQGEIDAALAERRAESVGRPAYLVIQDEIDAALAERRALGSSSDG